MHCLSAKSSQASVDHSGGADALRIGYQNRPDLFKLNISLPGLLNDKVIEVQERLSASAQMLIPFDKPDLVKQLDRAQQQGFCSCAIVFMHGYRYFIGSVIAILIAPFSFLKPILVPDSTLSLAVESAQVAAQSQPIPVKVIEKKRHNVTLPDFAIMRDGKQKKRQFFDFLRPAIVSENQKSMALRQQLEAIIALALKLDAQEQPDVMALSPSQADFVTHLARQYKVNSHQPIKGQLKGLLNRLDIIPMPLMMVQAANESAWGTSRFAQIGLNFFGLWCYRPSCGMVPNGRVKDATHEVQILNSVDQAVRRYLHNSNTNAAYNVFRSIRWQLRLEQQSLQADVFAFGLLPYSQRGVEYVLELNNMIRHNRHYIMPAAELEGSVTLAAD